DDPAPALGDRLDRLVPRDRHEVTRALAPDPSQGRLYPKRRMDALGVLAHLAADHAPGERMLRITGDGRQAAVVDGHDEAAARGAIVRTNRQHQVRPKVS